LWWVNFGCLPGAYLATLTPTLQEDREENAMENVKDREITHQLPLQAKQTLLGEN